MFVTRSSNGPLVAERRTPVPPKEAEPVKPLAPKAETRFVSPERAAQAPRTVTAPGSLTPAQHSASQVYGMVSSFT